MTARRRDRRAGGSKFTCPTGSYFTGINPPTINHTDTAQANGVDLPVTLVVVPTV